MIPFSFGGEKMEFGADTWWLVGLAVTIAIGIIGYFLKRTMSKQDQHEADINHIKLTYVTTSMDKLQKDVEEIKENTLSKADFYRSQAKTDDKMDKIYDMLIELSKKG